MNAVKLYAIEVVFLLAFWIIMFRYVKPSLAVVIVFGILFAIMFLLLDLLVAEK